MGELKLQTGERVLELLADITPNPMEAFKQFVENAADAIQEAEITDGVIHIELQRPASHGRKGKAPVTWIAVRDNGIGMSHRKMAEEVAKSIGDSEKITKALRGEKGVGLLAFANLCEEVHIASSPDELTQSVCLILKKEWLPQRRAWIEETCRPHLFQEPGTRVYLMNILPSVADKLTKERLKKYLGREFASDLVNNAYGIQIRDGRGYEPVEPSRYRGMQILRQSLEVFQGTKALVELYAIPRETEDAHVSLLGRAGSRICTVVQLEDFSHKPWTDKRLEGYIRYDHLRRAANKAGVVEDHNYRQFVERIRLLEPSIASAIEEVAKQQDEKELAEILTKVRFLIRELASRLSISPFTEASIATTDQVAERGIVPDELNRAPGGENTSRRMGQPSLPIARRDPNGDQPLRTLPVPQLRPATPPKDKRLLRSWYDDIDRLIYVNEEHRDFLEARHERLRFARYLTHIWIKEAMLLQHGQNATALSDEMVGVISQAEALFSKYF